MYRKEIGKVHYALKTAAVRFCLQYFIAMYRENIFAIELLRNRPVNTRVVTAFPWLEVFR